MSHDPLIAHNLVTAMFLIDSKVLATASLFGVREESVWNEPRMKVLHQLGLVGHCSRSLKGCVSPITVLCSVAHALGDCFISTDSPHFQDLNLEFLQGFNRKQLALLVRVVKELGSAFFKGLGDKESGLVRVSAKSQSMRMSITEETTEMLGVAEDKVLFSTGRVELLESGRELHEEAGTVALGMDGILPRHGDKGSEHGILFRLHHEKRGSRIAE
jgi:hypothetical protein